MVDWIRPGYWAEEEFRREYRDPIEAGQSADASAAQLKEVPSQAEGCIP